MRSAPHSLAARSPEPASAPRSGGPPTARSDVQHPGIGASAAGYALGLAAGAALVAYGTDLGDLALMGLVSGTVLGAAQGLVLAREGHRELTLPWATAMPLLFALGWCASTAIGVDVDDQFTVFGAAGSITFMVLSGLLLAHFTSNHLAS